MSSSYGHKVRRLTADEWERDRNSRGGDVHPDRMRCGAPKCQHVFTCIASYAYVTGRAGRTTRARREYCESHAQAFAKKHGLVMPEAAATHAENTLPTGLGESKADAAHADLLQEAQIK